MFFSFDGVDGTGKSTQLELFCDWLRAQQHDVVACRDPGGTGLGEKIRSILLDTHDTHIHRRSEMLLYQASRAQLIEEVIRPSLAAGKTVVSDRFLLATIVYQGYAGGLDVDDVKQVGRVATDDILPDVTFVLDMSAERAAARIDREKDRMESQGTQYLELVRRGYLTEAEKHPDRMIVLDADRTVDTVQQEIRERARPFLAMDRG
jgi:dTMP kinase